MNPITTALLGLSVADAIGVPVEFQSRDELDKNPVTDIRGYGTYNQPPGYFSDDSSLAFGLAESLATGKFDLVDQAKRLINYKEHGYWTPEHQIFDIGMTTQQSIDKLSSLLRDGREAELPTLHESARESDNGNGALMRIFPLYAYLRDKPVTEWIAPIWQHSALTHGHIRSACCCFLYLRFCAHLIHKETKEKALEFARRELLDFLVVANLPIEELDALATLIKADFSTLARTQVQGSGYVVECLEAALWCLFNAEDYRDTVLKAVNLGRDTDTTACVAGAPAALLYGVESIPANWLAALARREDIIELGNRLAGVYKV
ncbi:ADP-ribosylglycohydrolase family protein [Neolewinella agarilytica]|uniref:ADP-ribosylglycohydrolase n=1 Tax=Neolewinella agarilytica TaxID=478744 RepID=A0A1H9N3T7_9BACT|nr:ADP-ribosylglycohydrolase family protein [Neolewinella agarilytica]SER30315.1 ADP-ribosylglycohydrolase [Neolewinella agarilytica]